VEVILGLIYLAVVILCIAGAWKMFKKAGKPGWGCIIPFYNTYLMTQIGGLPIVWFILTFIPIANIVAAFVIAIAIAKSFGKGGGFGVGIVFLPFIFYPVLGFGDAQYKGAPPVVAAAPAAQAPPPPRPPGQ